ncbi:hypothetical protein PMAYCL1PPCAC_19855, partial [Pristionchus mayeri]
QSSLFHPNLRRMVTFLLAHSYIHVVCRVPLILYITQMIHFDLSEDVGIVEIVVIVASLLRFYHGLTVLFLYCATVIERCFATIYIHNYETIRSIRISVVLRLSVIAISLFFAMDVTFAICEIFRKLEIACNPNLRISPFKASFYLYFYNRHRLKHVLKRPESYSLSLRYQLIENMRSFMFLQVISTVGVVGIGINTVIILIPQFSLYDDINARALCGAAFETLY